MVRLKYISRFAHDVTDEELDLITEEADRNNAALGITGVLFASGGLFVQVLEGPDDVVLQLYEAIASDPRHCDVLLLDVERSADERLFPGWAMKRLQADDDAPERMEPLRAILATIAEQRARTVALTNVLEKAVWAELRRIVDASDLSA